MQHIREEDLWLQKGSDTLWEKIQCMMSAVQEIVTQTTAEKFHSNTDNVDYGLQLKGISIIGAFPTDIEEINKKIQLPRPIADPLALYKTKLNDIK